jgi:hypothetical protein
MNEKCNNFGKDVFNLYLRTKNAEVESLYLKFAEDYSQHIGESILSHRNIRGKISNPIVYDALELLAGIKKDFGNDIKIGNIAKIFSSNDKNTRTIPVISAFNKLIVDNRVGDVLSPFSNIIAMVVSTFKIVDSEERSKIVEQETQDVLADLLLIKRMMHKPSAPDIKEPATRKMNVRDQRFQMFKSLLSMFSEDIAKACEHVANESGNTGFTDLASQFRNGILAKFIPDGLGQYIDFKSISNDKMRMAGQLALYAIKYCGSKYVQYNHDYIDVTLLRAAGEITEEDVKSFQDTFRKERSIEKMLTDETKPYQGLDTYGKITLDKRLNPDYIYMLSVFFVVMQAKMGVPGVV